LPQGERLYGVALHVVVKKQDGQLRVCEIRRAGPGCLNAALRAAIRMRGFKYVAREVEYSERQYVAVFGRGSDQRRFG
jgi:hypothetical protein